jgi:hypothetical protein
MRVLAIGALVAALAACGSKSPGQSVCDNVVPAPAACMTMCDPKPGAANTCPGGYHCAPDGFCDAVCTPQGGECGDGYICTPDGRCKGEDECEGLECNIVDCAGQGKPETQIKGTVFAPNGTLPLYGISVYIPLQPVPAFTDGASCARCTDQLPGIPIAQTTTDEAGNFTLSANVPAGTDIPLVITSGKWRRQIKIATVTACSDTTVPAADSRLPKNRSEGDMPKIALSTGGADSLECLLRRMGIDDSEIGTDGGPQRIHLYDDKNSGGRGVNAFNSGFAGGTGAFADSKTLWSNLNKLKEYDIVILSCEGDHHLETKDQTDMNNMKAYADFGGRVFMSHWHNVWIGGAFKTSGGNPKPAVWADPTMGVANWQNQNDPGSGTIDVIDEQMNPKGSSFATWMQNVMGSTVRGEIPIKDGTAKTTCSAVKNGTERWTYLKGTQRPQNFQFTTPFEVAQDQRCGKVAFSDMHVSGNAGSGTYPSSCGDAGTPAAMIPQEKALAFMLFDLASCVSVIL